MDLPRFAEGAGLPEAAAAWAAAGWRVHPCSPSTKRPLLAKDKHPDTGKPVDGTGWGSKATAEAAAVAGWWTRWPKAMIGLATGDDRLFVLDFDPRADAETGEVWTLEQLKADTEAAIGCALPTSVTSITQSGGVHLWLRWPDDGGEPIRNRGNLPDHVDVRGLGGYVVAPPSVMASGGRYRWMKGRTPDAVEVAEAPAALVALLRSRKGGDAAPPPATPTSRADTPPRSMGSTGDPVEAARRRYAIAALDNACEQIRSAPSGQRNEALNSGAFAVAQFVAAGVLDAGIARASVEAAAAANAGRDDAGQLRATIDSGWNAGLGMPKDMSGIGLNAGRSRAAPRRDGPAERSTEQRGAGANDRARQPRSPTQRGGPSTLPNGGVADIPKPGEAVALIRRGGAWLRGRIAGLTPYDGSGEARQAGERLAYSIGRKVGGALIDPVVASIGLWTLIARDPDNGERLDDAAADGRANPAEAGAWLTDLRCAALPMTDMGNAERFIARFGQDYRFTTAKGWMGWDGRRWRVLDQENDVTPAEVMAAVFRTVRAIQDEARAIAATGYRRSDGAFDGMDYVWKSTRNSVTMFSDALSGWGRTSEGASRLSCIATLAKRWITVSIEDFDTDPFAINCLNGTVRLRRWRDDAGVMRAAAELVPHDRADLIAKLAPVDYCPEADAPIYDALMLWAQPDAAMRRYLHQWGGYSASGHVGAQILHFWYGLGANGKSTVIDAWAGALGDYAGTIQIDTFLDQGLKKRGDAATPDLARLGGVRLLRASEPERGAKLNEALIKAATGGEPMAVRALHKGFFDLRPQFKLTIGGNYKPDVPGTDEGIWRRIKLILWNSFLEEKDRDGDLPNKLATEYSGIFLRLVDGLLDWMAGGFAEPDAVAQATADYRDDSDPIARFLRMCVERAPGQRVQSSELHAVYCAWAKAAGEYEWKQKRFSQEMKAKGFTNKQSNGMQFLDVRLIKQAGDFIDADGRVIALHDDVTGEVAGNAGAPPPQWMPGDDDYDPMG